MDNKSPPTPEGDAFRGLPEEFRPARNYSWEPFPSGNTAAVRHGAQSDRMWGPVAERFRADIIELCPWLSRPVYAASVQAWARVEAKLQLVASWLDEVGVLDEEGNPRPATTLAARLERQAQLLRQELGLSPLALAKLVATFGQAATAGGHIDDAIEALMADGRRLLEARAGQERSALAKAVAAQAAPDCAPSSGSDPVPRLGPVDGQR